MFDVEKFCTDVTKFMNDCRNKVFFDEDGIANVSKCLAPITNRATINWITDLVMKNSSFNTEFLFVESNDVLVMLTTEKEGI